MENSKNIGGLIKNLQNTGGTPKKRKIGKKVYTLPSITVV